MKHFLFIATISINSSITTFIFSSMLQWKMLGQTVTTKIGSWILSFSPISINLLRGVGGVIR